MLVGVFSNKFKDRTFILTSLIFTTVACVL
jgi:hypothetical protein